MIFLAYLWMVAVFAWTGYTVSKSFTEKTPVWIGNATFMLLMSQYMILRVATA